MQHAFSSSQEVVLLALNVRQHALLRCYLVACFCHKACLVRPQHTTLPVTLSCSLYVAHLRCPFHSLGYTSGDAKPLKYFFIDIWYSSYTPRCSSFKRVHLAISKSGEQQKTPARWQPQQHHVANKKYSTRMSNNRKQHSSLARKRWAQALTNVTVIDICST